MNYFENKVPMLTNLFKELQQSDEYNNSLIVAEDCRRAEQLIDIIKSSDKSTSEDIMLSAVNEFELSGFVLGITYILGIVEEIKAIKELGNVHAYT